ncbi:MAG: hypothetical protein RL514_1511 [Verrucomicrobiota bacterium]|jgi:hypothetical protein
MPFDNPLLAKLFEGILEGRDVAFRLDEPTEEAVRKSIALLPISLSKQQRNAVVRAWTHEVSYIQGPPGTGKSHTITAIMLAALFLKKRVLLVSHKKPAIDVVFAKLRNFLGPGSVVYASSDTGQRSQMRGELQQWLVNVGTLQGQAQLEQMRQQRARYRGKVEQLKSELDTLEADISKALDREKDYYQLQERLDQNRKAYRKQFNLAGVDSPRLSNSADVPLASAALAAVTRWLDEELPNNEGRLSRVQALQVRRLFAACSKQFHADSDRLQPSLAATSYLREHLDLTEDHQCASAARERVHDDLLRQLRHRFERKQADQQKAQTELVKAHLGAQIIGMLQENNNEVQQFCGMIRHANPTLIAARMEAISFRKLIDTLPLWVGQMRHLGEFLPFEPNLFDLVVVDEASQVNIAEIIPAFYRGSRICVVGDDKQLGLNAAGVNFGFGVQFEELIWNRHFPPPRSTRYADADERKLLVRKHSILDFIRSLPDGKVPKTTLDEHFRSYPQLASFTSQQFYADDGGLRLMKEVPRNFELECFGCIEVRGERDPDLKLIQTEVDELMRWLKKLIKQRHFEHEPIFRAHGFDQSRPPTLGVISFLREQRNAILEAVSNEFSPAEVEAFQLLVGTPEEFQGNERDIIFITLGLAGTETRVNHWEERRRFNVATSRAIHYTMLIYGGMPQNARLIKSYLSHFGKTWRARTEAEAVEVANQPAVQLYRWDWNRKLHRELCESEFEHRVADYLEKFVSQNGGEKRIRLFNQVLASAHLGVSSCGQKRLDFVLFNADKGSCVAVEVDGREHYTQDGRSYSEVHLERVEVLRRAGWEIVHIPYYRWWRGGWLSDQNEAKFESTVEELYSELRTRLQLAP